MSAFIPASFFPDRDPRPGGRDARPPSANSRAIQVDKDTGTGNSLVFLVSVGVAGAHGARQTAVDVSHDPVVLQWRKELHSQSADVLTFDPLQTQNHREMFAAGRVL